VPVETGDVLGRRAADASVRPASVADTAAIGAVQARCWRAAYTGLAPHEALDRLDAAALADRWRAAVTAPPSPRHAVLVACTGSTVVGFAALAPSTDADAADTDAELVALEVDPLHQRAGHGSRLLAASVDTLRESRFSDLRVWCPDPDEARHAFLVSAGLRADGASRELSGDGASVTERRLSAALGS
jgi:ribosomal protein S18 acetylase RimI-like enzyme